jgi:SAM-dependent methyltransferase
MKKEITADNRLSQVTSGLRSVLSAPLVYDSFQKLTGARRARQQFADDYIRAKTGARVLDIGCGTAEILDHLPGVDYYGFDLSADYIEAAKQRYGRIGTFRCEDVTDNILRDLPSFDIALAIGVMHHLDDDGVLKLLRLARDALKVGGRLVSLDPCYVDGQSSIGRLIISKDRGRNVRDERGYRTLCEAVFSSVESHIRHDLLRIPYTHVTFTCTRL